MGYVDHYKTALGFTQSLGFAVPVLEPVDGELVTPENGEKVLEVLKRDGIRDLAPSALQCLKWSHALQPLVEEGLGCSIALTVGQILIGNRVAFDPSNEDFTAWARRGIQPPDFLGKRGFNFHAWYTLPTMEVLDLTLWSSLALIWENKTKAGEVVGGWPDAMSPYPAYVPMVVGNSYVEHVAHISAVPLLSRDRSQQALSEPAFLLTRV